MRVEPYGDRFVIVRGKKGGKRKLTYFSFLVDGKPSWTSRRGMAARYYTREEAGMMCGGLRSMAKKERP